MNNAVSPILQTKINQNKKINLSKKNFVTSITNNNFIKSDEIGFNKKNRIKKMAKYIIPAFIAIGTLFTFLFLKARNKNVKTPDIQKIVPDPVIPVKTQEELCNDSISFIDKILTIPDGILQKDRAKWFEEATEQLESNKTKVFNGLDSQSSSRVISKIKKKMSEVAELLTRDSKKYNEVSSIEERANKTLANMGVIRYPTAPGRIDMVRKYIRRTDEMPSNFAPIPSKKGTLVYCGQPDISDEITNWNRLRVKYNEANRGLYGGDLIRTDFGFEIEPSTYSDDTDMLAMLGLKGFITGNQEYQQYAFKTGDNAVYYFSFPKDVVHWIQTKDHVNLREYFGKRNTYLRTMCLDDGRKALFTNLNYGPLRRLEDSDERGNMGSYIVLCSKGEEFTQLQKDLIRIFSDPKNKFEINNCSGHFSYIFTPESKSSCYISKSAFLSLIQSWAKNSAEINVDKLLQEVKDNLILKIE